MGTLFAEPPPFFRSVVAGAGREGAAPALASPLPVPPSA